MSSVSINSTGQSSCHISVLKRSGLGLHVAVVGVLRADGGGPPAGPQLPQRADQGGELRTDAAVPPLDEVLNRHPCGDEDRTRTTLLGLPEGRGQLATAQRADTPGARDSSPTLLRARGIFAPWRSAGPTPQQRNACETEGRQPGGQARRAGRPTPACPGLPRPPHSPRSLALRYVSLRGPPGLLHTEALAELVMDCARLSVSDLNSARIRSRAEQIGE